MFALTVHDVVAFAISCNHAVDDGEGILQIRIQEHDRIATRVIQPCCGSDLMTEIAGQMKDLYTRIMHRPRGGLLDRTVRAAIVDQDDFGLHRQRAQEACQLAAQDIEDGLLVIHGDDEGQPGRLRPWLQNVKCLPRVRVRHDARSFSNHDSLVELWFFPARAPCGPTYNASHALQ